MFEYKNTNRRIPACTSVHAGRVGNAECYGNRRMYNKNQTNARVDERNTNPTHRTIIGGKNKLCQWVIIGVLEPLFTCDPLPPPLRGDCGNLDTIFDCVCVKEDTLCGRDCSNCCYKYIIQTIKDACASAPPKPGSVSRW